MTKHLARELDDLHHDILSMCAMVEEMVHQAVDELTEPNYDRARAMAVKDDEIDEWDVRIEEECLKILAMHQPVATDLRRISSVLKIANELERVADLAVHIAERACGLVTWPEVYAPANLKEMAAIAGEMLRNSIDAYVDMDSGLARRVCSRDEIVDRLNSQADEGDSRLHRAFAALVLSIAARRACGRPRDEHRRRRRLSDRRRNHPAPHRAVTDACVLKSRARSKRSYAFPYLNNIAYCVRGT
jgi:phosphate transport system protein